MNETEIHKTLDHLFRRQAAQLVATLTRIFGTQRMDLAESVVQDALVQAMQTWPHQGIPENPAGWLLRVARNRALDVVRKERLVLDKEGEATLAMTDGLDHTPPPKVALKREEELRDDQLRMLFICSHPVLSQDARSALALKTLFGLGVREIAGALLADDKAVAQRLVRAKAKIREANLPFELPAPAELPDRLPSVLEVLYLLFTEGYSTHGGDELVRKDICHEALRLTTMLTEHPRFALPEVHALVALMAFNASRLDARTDTAGDLLLLGEQDRSLWQPSLIAHGAWHLERAMSGDSLSSYHLQAGIAACHAFAPSADATDWRQIVLYYDSLVRVNPSPVVALNRAAAVAMADGPTAGLATLAPLKAEASLKSYYLLPGIEGELHARLGDTVSARKCFEAALALRVNAAERRWIEKRLAAVTS